MEKIEFQGIANTLRLANDQVELMVTTDVGPRILGFNRIGEKNVMGWFPDLLVETEFGPWKAYGGHRLWVAPEILPHTYAPDSAPVKYFEDPDGRVRVSHDANAAGFEKEMVITLLPSGAEIRHQITNLSVSPATVAGWTPTIMAGGTAIVPIAPHKAHGDELAPSQSLILWPYTDLSDARIQFHSNAICVSADPLADQANKIGLAVHQGWAARHKDNTLFVKRFAYDPTEPYTHRGTNCEIFTKNDFLEVESLGVYRTVEPGESLIHVETWELIPNVPSVEAAMKLLLG